MPDQPQADAPEELSIEEQLDALLVQLEQVEPGLLNPPEPPKPIAAPQPVVEAESNTETKESSELAAAIDAAAIVEEAPMEVAGDATQAVAQDPPSDETPAAEPPAPDAADQVIEQQIDQQIEDLAESATEAPDAEPTPAVPAVVADQTAPTTQDTVASGSDDVANKLDQLLSQQIEGEIDDLEAGISAQGEDAAAASDLDVANEIDMLVDQELATSAQGDQPDPPVQEVGPEDLAPPTAEKPAPTQEPEAAEMAPVAGKVEAVEDDDGFDQIAAMVAPPEIEPKAEATPEGAAAPDLTEQLQALLEQAEHDEEVAKAAAPQQQEAEEPAAAPLQEPVAAQQQPPPSEEQDVSLDDIDRLLAEEADGVDDEFGMPVGAPVAATATADESGAPGQQHDPFQDAVSSDTAEGQPQPVGEPLDLSAGGFNADAQAVAQELDEQPEHRPSLKSAGQIADEQKQADTPNKLGLQVKIAVCEKHLRKTCYVMNWPLRKAPPAVREIVGYAALLQLFIGSVLILGKMTGLI